MRWRLACSCLAAMAIGMVPITEVAADPAPAQTDHAAVLRVLDLTNAERGKVGLAPLVLSPELQAAAQTYSQVLAGGICFEHTCGPVPNLEDRDAAVGYIGWTTIGENIAGGYPTPEAVVAGWMGSAGHRANILSATFTEIGIGVASGNARFGVCWTEEFGTRDDSGDDG
jgi:uncharacterized protein YkwD